MAGGENRIYGWERCHVEEDNRTRKEEERGMVVSLVGGTCGKGDQAQSLPSLNSNKMEDDPEEKEEAREVRSEGDEASTVEGGRTYERKA